VIQNSFIFENIDTGGTSTFDLTHSKSSIVSILKGLMIDVQRLNWYADLLVLVVQYVFVQIKIKTSDTEMVKSIVQ
jgi:hypothetical protein